MTIHNILLYSAVVQTLSIVLGIISLSIGIYTFGSVKGWWK